MGLLNFEWTGGRKSESGGAPMLQIEHVSVRIGQRLVLDDVSLEVCEGEQVRITGPNGAGKSTLFNAITGVLPLNDGRIVFKGRDISRLPTHERTALGIRYMRQRENVFPSLSVQENLQLAVGNNCYESFAERFPEWAKEITPSQSAGMLSGGQKQKLAWAMTVLSGCSLSLFDEPQAGIEVGTKMGLPALGTAMIIEHD